jgi:hypothetical protein
VFLLVNGYYGSKKQGPDARGGVYAGGDLALASKKKEPDVQPLAEKS